MNPEPEADDRYTLSMGKANLLALPFVAASVLLFVPFGLLYGWEAVHGVKDSFFSWYIFAPSFILGIIVHEFIHGLTWKLAGHLTMAQIKYGFMLKTLTPYAHATAPMRADAYRLGAAMPLIVLGILPYLAALATGNGFLMGFSFLFTFSAAGDMMILWIIRSLPAATQVQDHPTKGGVMVFG